MHMVSISSKSEVFEFSGAVTFSNSDELFQSKVMWKELVRIGRNQRYVSFRGTEAP